MHDLLVGNVINYSLVGIRERKACKCVFDTKQDKTTLRYYNPSLCFSKQDSAYYRYYYYAVKLSVCTVLESNTGRIA